MNVAVIGVGKFGRNYARILSQLNGICADVPTIDNLIVTRTTTEGVQASAAELQTTSPIKIIGCKVSTEHELEGLLEKHTPQFIAITAKDAVFGNSIHPSYTRIALRYGNVLCEKPFSNAIGDGTSLSPIEDMLAAEGPNSFGLELPFAVVARDMMQNGELRNRLFNSEKMRFYWAIRGSERNDVIDNIALHPWSLIPEAYSIGDIKVDDRRREVDIIARLCHSTTGKEVRCEIRLRYGHDFRGMELDGYVIAIKSQGPLNVLVGIETALDKAASTGYDGLNGNELLAVDNPLKQHIVAALSGVPFVGLGRAYESQLFLERLHGFSQSAQSL